MWSPVLLGLVYCAWPHKKHVEQSEDDSNTSSVLQPSPRIETIATSSNLSLDDILSIDIVSIVAVEDVAIIGKDLFDGSCFVPGGCMDSQEMFEPPHDVQRGMSMEC